MGLGKTLQTIALLYTLLKQNPIYGAPGVIKKALIVCPVTLIRNWKKEFNKWLGAERCGVFVVDGEKKPRLRDFTHGNSYSVMIIGYEKLRLVQKELKEGAGIDIVIADEGHRLKTAKNKSAEAIISLDTAKRIILSGTPLQNDLSEFYTMVNFVNPGVLGPATSFRNQFEKSINKSREPGASSAALELGNAREQELSDLTRQFILRRTAEVLSRYLPPKAEYIIFCKPTQAQAEVYQHVLASPVFGAVMGSSEASLQLITLLKKVCNAPSLLQKRINQKKPTNPNVAALLEIIPSYLLSKAPVEASSKFRVLDRMLKYLHRTTEEKIVLVSNYTSTLDLLQAHLTSLSLPFSRLDGTTPANKRQELVDNFNRTNASKQFAFLLSAKSGGAGINLIGASRLVLFDVDWNPATDLQAMARIHRDGQKRPVKIYRFLMSGGMDEKIYQRQVTKMGLADSVVDGKKNEASFSAEELRDLFKLNLQAGCQTHELLACECAGTGALHEAPLEAPSSCSPAHNANDEDEDEDDSNDDLPSVPQLVKASKANVEALNEQITRRQERDRRRSQSSSRSSKQGKMQALMQYRHIDAGIVSNVAGVEHDAALRAERDTVVEVLDDECLLHVMGEERCKVGYVFMKRG